MHPDFARRAELEYMERLKANDSASAIDRPRIFKQAVQQVSRNFKWNPMQFDEALSTEDRLGATLRLIWAVEQDTIVAFNECLHRYPYLATLCPNPYRLFDSSFHLLAPFKSHAADLAKEHALDESASSTRN